MQKCGIGKLVFFTEQKKSYGGFLAYESRYYLQNIRLNLKMLFVVYVKSRPRLSRAHTPIAILMESVGFLDLPLQV